jgi:hypothetical protein
MDGWSNGKDKRKSGSVSHECMIQKNTKHSFDSQDLSQLIPLVPDIIHRPKIPRQARDSPHHPSILSPFLSQHILAGATYKSCSLLPKRPFTLHGVQITRLTFIPAPSSKSSHRMAFHLSPLLFNTTVPLFRISTHLLLCHPQKPFHRNS